MKPEFEMYEEGWGAALKCPSCGFNYLHQEVVEIFERVEDAVDGLHVKVEKLSLTADTNLKGNPSRRRHGLTIKFSCEGCNCRPVLEIIQHKGNTFVDFNCG